MTCGTMGEVNVKLLQMVKYNWKMETFQLAKKKAVAR